MVRTRLVRAYPAHNLKESLVVTEIIMNQNAGLPIDRKLLAEALNTSDRSSSFTTLLAASQQYGLTVGKYNSDEISVTALSKSLFESVGHSSHTSYMLKAAYLPEKFQEIHNLLKDQPLPEGRFLKNLVLQNIKIHETQVEEFVDIYTSNYVFINERGKAQVITEQGRWVAEHIRTAVLKFNYQVDETNKKKSVKEFTEKELQAYEKKYVT